MTDQRVPRTTHTKLARAEQYAKLRSEGLSNEQASKELGVTAKTGWRYSAITRREGP